jgi:hypothetical protein
MNKSFGTQGYLIFDWGGAGANLANYSSSFTITKGSGWVDFNNLERQFNVNNVAGSIMGLSASPIGSINIAVSDSNFHYLTVVSPSTYGSPRLFTLGVISTNGASAQYSINDANTHTFQFLFRGNITLQANVSGGTGAFVQALFLDNATVAGMSNLPPIPPAPPSPPTGLYIVSSNGPNSSSPSSTNGSSTNNVPTNASVLVTGQSVGSPLRNNETQAVGFQFNCASNATCYSLGRWVVAGNSQPHVVALCSSNGTVLAYATVATSGATPGAYAYGVLATPYPLTAGTTYCILSQETLGGDLWHDVVGNNITVTREASSVCGVFTTGGTLPSPVSGYYACTTLPGQSYVPVNMQYTAP